MSELCDTKEMVERLKDIISRQPSFGGEKVFDKHIADALGLNNSNLATMKRRDSPPLREIILFCDRCGIDQRTVLFKSC